MRFFIAIVSIVLLSILAMYFMPWWTVAFVAFIVSLLMKQKPSKAFLMGFLGEGITWLMVAMMRDTANEHILSGRMAVLFHLPHYGLFIIVTALIGGLVGGLWAWAGALLRA